MKNLVYCEYGSVPRCDPVREIISDAPLCEFNACSIDPDSIPLPRIMVMYFPLPYYVKC